jgi:hypothetical protein
VEQGLKMRDTSIDAKRSLGTLDHRAGRLAQRFRALPRTRSCARSLAQGSWQVGGRLSSSTPSE